MSDGGRDDHYYAQLRVAARAFAATEAQLVDKNSPEIGAALDLLYKASRRVVHYEYEHMLESCSSIGLPVECDCNVCTRMRNFIWENLR